MNEVTNTRPETEALRNRLSSLSEASPRITESLDLDTILKGVIDGARSLTGARYGALLILDDEGRMQDLVTSGMTPKERRRLGALPKGLELLGYLSEIEGPLRLAEIAGHPNSVGFPEGHPPMKTFLGAPVRHRGERLGNIYLTEKEGGQEFTPEDEETLVMFASQAALTVSNARRYRDERQVRANLEALVRHFAGGHPDIRREDGGPGVAEPGDEADRPRAARAGTYSGGTPQCDDLPAPGRA